MRPHLFPYIKKKQFDACLGNILVVSKQKKRTRAAARKVFICLIPAVSDGRTGIGGMGTRNSCKEHSWWWKEALVTIVLRVLEDAPCLRNMDFHQPHLTSYSSNPDFKP